MRFSILDLTNCGIHCMGVLRNRERQICRFKLIMMTSSNGNIFCVTGLLCREFTGHRWFPAQKPVARSFGVFFGLHQNKLLSKQSWDWWFETPSCPLWRHCNVVAMHVVAVLHLVCMYLLSSVVSSDWSVTVDSIDPRLLWIASYGLYMD